MNKQDYLKRLYDLKAFLKAHPEQVKVYSDLKINQSILTTKYAIMQEETEEYYEQTGLQSDGFHKTDFNPFL